MTIWKTLLAAGAIAVAALLAGSALSLLPDSPLDGVYLGILVSTALVLPIYAVLRRLRVGRPSSPRAQAFNIHSLLGLVFGVLFSVVFITGVILLYRPELEQARYEWLKLEVRQDQASATEWLAAVGEHTDLMTSNRIDIEWPANSSSPVTVNVSGPQGGLFYVNPYSAEIIEGTKGYVMNLIRRIHVALAAGTIGHWLVGLVGLASVWLCVSGITMGRRIFRDWYRVRVRSGKVTLLKDLHKRVGLWLLPFIALNGLAGMLAAFFGLFGAGPIEARFDGNYNALYEAVGSPQGISRSGVDAAPDVDNFVALARTQMPDADVSSVRILGYGDSSSVISVKSTRADDLAPYGASQIVNIRATDGHILMLRQLPTVGVAERINMAFSAFHFAEYGPAWVRLVHAVLAALAGLLPIAGLLMWLARRRRNSSSATRNRA